MYRYRFPGIHIESRYNWTWPTILLAIAFGIGLLLIIRQFPSPNITRHPPSQPLFQSNWPTQQTYRRPPFTVTPKYDDDDLFPEIPSARKEPSPQHRMNQQRPLPVAYRRRLTKKQKKDLLRSQMGRCRMCGKAMYDWEVAVDHWIPLASQYLHSRSLNDLSNLCCLCVRCHTYKTAQERQQGLYRRDRR
jgi:5-methylcytosine-specific restriction endonuclease McrA